MPQIADYKVILSNPIEIKQPNNPDDTFGFNLESGAALNHPAILTFVLTLQSGALNAVCEVTINPGPSQDTQVYATPTGVSSYTLHKVVKSGVLKLTGNEVQFRMLPGMAPFKIDDVVLHYQRNI